MKPTVAINDQERLLIEAWALMRVMVTARDLPVVFTTACHDNGFRSVDFTVDRHTVRFSYPIWYVPDNAAVSFQVDVSALDEPPITLMTGLDADASRPALKHLVRVCTDPVLLSIILRLHALGEDSESLFAVAVR